MKTKIQELISSNIDMRYIFIKSILPYLDYKDKYISDICKTKTSSKSKPLNWRTREADSRTIAEIVFKDTIGNHLNTKLKKLTDNLSNITVVIWRNMDGRSHIVCHTSKTNWFNFSELGECIGDCDQSVKLQIQKIMFKYLT